MNKIQKCWKKHKRLLLVHLICLGILLLGFVLCRYVFFCLHGMKEWPFDLLVFGLIAMIMSLLVRKQYVPWFISVEYFVGFWAGIFFYTEGYDPGGGKTDNLWIIWTAVFLGCILAGVVFEIVLKWRRLLKKHPQNL